MEISEAVVKRIKHFMLKKDMSFYELEKRSGIQHGTISAVRYGKTKNITLRTIMQLCKGLNITLLEFLDDPIFNFDNFDLE